MRARCTLLFAVLMIAFTACSHSTPRSSASESGKASRPGPTEESSTPGTRAAPGPAGGSPAPRTTTAKPTGGTNTKPNGVTPAPGTYTYDQSGTYDTQDGPKSYPPSGTLAVEAPTHDPKGWHQHSTRKRTNDAPREATYLFSRTQIGLEGFAAQGYGCTLSKPLKILPQPAKAGQSWTDSASCTTNGVQLDFKIQASISRTEAKTIGGAKVSTLVVRSHTTVTVGGGFAQQDQTSTTWYSPAYHVIVRTEEHSESTQGVAPTMKSDFVENLTNLEPA